MNIKYLLLLALITSGSIFSANNKLGVEGCEPKTWRKIGSYSPDKRIYTDKTDVIGFNFFCDTAYLYLPKDQTTAVRVKLASGKLKAKQLTFTEDMVQPEAKSPNVWYPAKNGAQTDDCGDYTIAVNWHENGMDRTIKVSSQNDTNIASFVCSDSKQLILNDHCFVCAGNGKKRTAIIIDAQTNKYVTINSDRKTGESTEIHPIVYYNNGLVFIQWPNSIYCVDVATRNYTIYNSAHTIETLQPSTDNHYMVVCERIPAKKGETTSFILNYQLFDLLNKPNASIPAPTIIEQPKKEQAKKKQSISNIFSFFKLNKKK